MQTNYNNDLDRYMAENKMSNADVACLIGVRRQLVHNWRTKRCKPSYGNRKDLKKALNINMDSFD